MTKKVAILTLPLITNYGAILQAYALQNSVKQLGYECWLIDKQLPVYPYYRRPLSIISRIIGKYLKGESGYDIFPYWMSKKVERIISVNTRNFVEKYLQPKTEPILTLSSKNDIFDVYIVGSDQVWRKSITLKMHDYLFGFVASNKKKCSYAASFGVDKWEFSATQTNKIKPLFQLFSCVSVREDSAVLLLKNNLGIDAIHVLDPTLLLNRDDYCSLLFNTSKLSENNYIFSYILDSDSVKSAIIDELIMHTKLSVVDIMPKVSPNYGVNLSDCIYARVEDWLVGFRDCTYVITDSFHGTVFSIIFNKPFFVLRNNKRGNTRLDSLLRTFCLDNRVISNKDDIHSRLSMKINWESVNRTLQEKRMYSLNILSEMIK